MIPVAFLCSAIRSELADLERFCADVPVRAIVVRERLDRIKALVGKLEEHSETEKGAANDG